ncbi:hypothetical protein GGI12_002997 [Dipsacomyces acuminosporus]|nr:hypothetical protein GGI12_002997 [Dipsacomyces acuminosporus]
MANQSAKRIVQENAARLAAMDKVYLAVNGIYLFVRFVLQYSSINWTESIAYFLTLALESFIYFTLYQSSRPRYDPGGVLLDPGADLSQPGLISYMFDFIYISWAVHLLSLVAKWAWFLYAAIPIYMLYVFGPYIRQLLMSQSGDAPSAEESEKEKKRREKKERKQQRVKYMR